MATLLPQRCVQLKQLFDSIAHVLRSNDMVAGQSYLQLRATTVSRLLNLCRKIRSMKQQRS